MTHPFDDGYGREPFRSLVEEYPGEDVYRPKDFRTEWGPVFHRGRLDGTARVLVIGQDPATHEAICRRILVGEAGQRVQGFLARLGVSISYVFVNAFLYSVYGQGGGNRNIGDERIAAYRNAWLQALADGNRIEGVVALGTLADKAYQASPLAASGTHAYAAMVHPTYPESASASGQATKAAAMARLCRSWNAALDVLHARVTADEPVPLRHYGDVLGPDDVAPIPERDLPPGLPEWMRDLRAWARRTGATPGDKRATITVTIPRGAIP